MNRWRRTGAALGVLVLLGACTSVGSGGTTQGTPIGGGDGGGGGNVDKANVTDAALTPSGGFEAEIDQGKFKVDYSDPVLNKDLKVQAGFTHRISTSGKTCVPAVSISVQRADTSCKLELEFKADFNGELVLDDVRFHAKAALMSDDGVPLETYPCEGWTKEPAKGLVVYEMVGGLATVDIGGPLDQPYAGQETATIPSRTIQPKGTVTMRFKGREFDLKLDGLKFTGTVVSQGGANVACAQEYKPLPELMLKDYNPKSPTYDQMVSMDDFKGKRVAVLMGAGW